jgi:hypothetical protein
MYLTKDIILGYISQEQIFERYLLKAVSLQAVYSNPLRHDPHPNCVFKYSESGILYLYDYSPKSKMAIDCFDLVRKLHRVDFLDCLRLIANDFNLEGHYKGETSVRKLVVDIADSAKSKDTSFVYTIKPFNTYSLKFWEQIHFRLTREFLQKQGVYLADSVYINDTLISDSKLLFIYKLSDTEVQLYKPSKFIKGNKHITLTRKSIFFVDKLDISVDYVCVVKSVKDYLVAKSEGYNVCCILTENLPTHEEDLKLMEYLLNSFTYVFTLFDNDRAGKVASVQFRRQFKTIPLIFPKTMKKDMSDNTASGNIHLINQEVSWLKRNYSIL